MTNPTTLVALYGQLNAVIKEVDALTKLAADAHDIEVAPGSFSEDMLLETLYAQSGDMRRNLDTLAVRIVRAGLPARFK